MKLFLYNLLYPFVLLLLLPAYLLKMHRRGGYRENFGQRLGFYHATTRRQLRQRRNLWIHAVSVGEVGVALRLTAELRRRDSAVPVILTVTTTTGYAVARQQAGGSCAVLYSPLDFWPVMSRALRVLNPEILVLVEAEVWPNMVSLAERRGVPVVLVNARLSPRSERRFLLGRSFIAPLFRKLSVVAVPEEADLARWERLGVSRHRLAQTGNIKFDRGSFDIDPAGPRALLAKSSVDSDRPILLGGSTHPGEEEALVEVFEQLRTGFPSLLLILAPRHVERSREIVEMLGARNLRVLRRTEMGPDAGADPDCLLLDQTGELRHWYAVATVVFIGKSLLATGGQNPIEPIFAGVPVVFGPYMQNFALLAEALLAADGAIQVKERPELIRAMDELLRDRARRAELVRNASTALEQHHGATARTAELIAGLRSATRGGGDGSAALKNRAD